MMLPCKMTIGECYGPAMEITDEAKATEYFDALVKRSVQCFGNSQEEAERVERINLGYYAGYYDSDTRARLERLFKCSHPVFGAIADKGPPSTDQALMSGVAAAIRK